MRHPLLSSRRGFIKAAAAAATGVALPAWAFKQAPAVIVSAAERPQALQGLHFGDPANGSVVVWSRSDRPARMLVDWSYNESFTNARRIVGPHALETTDFTARQDLVGLEFAELLRHLKREKVRNVVWLTADVHYCAAHPYDPARAAFRDFDAFWEFVTGPLNAGSFGPNALDGTFGPQVVFYKAPPAGQSNLSPFSGLQFFGEVNISAQGGDMTVDLRDLNGVSVFSRTLQPRIG